MNLKQVIQSQYLASLGMLKQAVVKCPPEAWDNSRNRNRFWFVAYHTLFWAHRYLKAQKQGYPRWEVRRYSQPGNPFKKEELLDRLALVEKDVVEQIEIMNLDQTIGALGLANKLEMQLYNIRHIQQHAGELYEKLSAYQNIKLGWVDQRSGPRRKAASLKEKK